MRTVRGIPCGLSRRPNMKMPGRRPRRIAKRPRGAALKKGGQPAATPNLQIGLVDTTTKKGPRVTPRCYEHSRTGNASGAGAAHATT